MYLHRPGCQTNQKEASKPTASHTSWSSFATPAPSVAFAAARARGAAAGWRAGRAADGRRYGYLFLPSLFSAISTTASSPSFPSHNRDSSFPRAAKPQPRARAPGIRAATSRGGGPYIAVEAVFSASEHGTFPSSHEATPTPSLGSCGVFSVKIALKGRGLRDRCTCPKSISRIIYY